MLFILFSNQLFDVVIPIFVIFHGDGTKCLLKMLDVIISSSVCLGRLFVRGAP